MPEPEEPWRGQAAASDGDHTCCKCGQAKPSGLGHPPWTPLKAGWRCIDCTIAYRKEIALEAKGMLRVGDKSWVGHDKHREYDECRHCDVIRAASEALLWA